MRETPPVGSRFIAIAIALYIVLVVAASFYFRISLTADRVAILLVIAALGTGRIRAFLRDWSAFVVVILAWQVLQGMSNSFTHLRPHVGEMIAVDRFLFHGTLPTLWLQQHFYHPSHIQWYDVSSAPLYHNSITHVAATYTYQWYDFGAATLYTLHFILPLGVAFALWFWKRQVFLQFMVSFMLLALCGFATYVVFPAAPPWAASQWFHVIPHVTKIFDQVMGQSQSYSAITQWTWNHGGWDVYGAVPSEHAAFPFLCFLYARRAWKRGGWILLPYCFLVWVAVVYLGEHYVTDVIVGVVYAALAYVAVQVGLRRREQAGQMESPAVAPVTERLPI